MAVRVVFKSDGKNVIRGSQIGGNEIKIRLEKMIKRVQPALQEYAESMSDEIHRYMVENHEWKNRTGEAEKSLYANVSTTEKKYSTTIEIGYGSHIGYSKYLENYYDEYYALIKPTITRFGPIMMDGVQGIMDTMGYGNRLRR